MRNGWRIYAFICALGGNQAGYADHPSFGLGSGVAGPVYTLSPHTLPRGAWVGGLRFETTPQDTFSRTELEANALVTDEVHNVDGINVVFLGLGYGITDSLSITASLPWVMRDNIDDAHLEDPGPPPEVHVDALGDASGLGDLTMLGHYRFLGEADAPFTATLLAGLRVPTGETRDKDAEGARFEAEFQPGSGAWSPLFGVAAQRSFGHIAVNASLLYTDTREGSQDTDLGDVLNYDLALVWRLPGQPHAHGNAANGHAHIDWDAILELNGEWRDRLEHAGHRDPNSGGNLFYLSPGLRAGLGKWSGFASVGIPVAENFYGVQNEPDWRLTLGVGRRFD